MVKKIIALSVGMLIFLVLFNFQEPKNEYAKILNVSGKQRMLSQRLFVLASAYYNKKTPELKKEIEDNLDLMQEAHQYLKTKIFTPELESIYFKQKLDKNLKIYLSNFYNLIETNEKKYILAARDSSDDILIQLDNAVKEYEKFINEKIQNTDFYKNLMIIGFLFTIIILLSIFLKLKSQLKINSNLSLELQKTMDMISKHVIFSKTNLKGIITDVSDAFCNISGYSRNELIGKPHNLIRHPDMLSSSFKNMWDTIQSGKTWEGEVKNLKKDGGYYWVIATISPDYDKNGNKKGYIAIRYDITNKKDFEDQHIKLLNSERMASIGEMIGNIAHQWRQPLSVISTAATGIQIQKEYDSLTDEKLNELCESINDNAQYLSKTIDDFRSFIKGDRTKSIFKLKDAIESFLNLVNGSIKSNNIKIILNLQDDIEVDGYENELGQCLINIFNNAKDILLEKEIKEKYIFISTSVQNNKAVIKIKDNAGGIPEDILPKIFEPYFTTKHKSQGTGLGLHMTYNLIVDGIKGTIEANNETYTYENKEYSGAEFVITLP